MMKILNAVLTVSVHIYIYIYKCAYIYMYTRFMYMYMYWRPPLLVVVAWGGDHVQIYKYIDIHT